MAYYDQEHQVLNMQKTLFDEISDTFPTLSNTKIRNLLAAFLFMGDDVYKRIGDLSGGERGRVSLAKLMLSNANFLVLDEPTNHLDIMSKEILESAIRDFKGTVLYVSHDRYFINKTATRILDLRHSKLMNYIGNYDYYLEKKEDVERYAKAYSTNDQKENVAISSNKSDWKQNKEEQAKLRKQKNALTKCEKSISELEEKILEIDNEFLKPENQTNALHLVELQKKKENYELELSELYEKWEKLAQELS